jgi:hypothetical protein
MLALPASVLLSMAVAGTSVAAGSPWVAKANATCRVWTAKAKSEFGPNPSAPSTPAGMFKFMLKARPIEAGELRDLKSIRLQRPAGANNALRFVALDIEEIDTGIAAYRAGNHAKFLRDVGFWQSDHRASHAFKAIGANACG